MVPYKRPAADKSGVPVYQPNATTYQQLMQLQQPFVPVSCEYPTSPAPPPSSTASPSIPEAAAAAHPAVHQTSANLPALAYQFAQQQQQQQAQQQQQQQQPVQQPQPPLPQPTQFSKENEPQIPLPASVTTTASLTSLPAQPVTVYHDPATLAKEVAQQNYAKAVKLAAMNQSIANSQLNHLNPLNYTGVSLNKQALSFPPPALRYPTSLPLGFGTAGVGLNLGLTHPYSAAALAQQNFFNLARPPPAAAAYQLNPYSIMRPTAYANVATTMSGSLLGAQYPTATVSAPPMTTVTPSAAASIAAAAAQNNNNNVVMQPYKKLKTS